MPIRFENSFFHLIGPKNDSIKIQFKTKSGIFIQKIIHSLEYRIFNKIIHLKNEDSYSKFQNKAKMWLQSPPEAPVQLIHPLKWTEIGPSNDP